MNKANILSPKFLTVWAGQLLSAVGSGLTAFALGVYVFQMTGSAASYSFTIFFSFLPCFVLLPFTGVLADRFDRRKLMIIGDTGATTGLIFILAVMLSGKLALWHIYLGVALSSVFTSIQIPAYNANITDLVMEEHYSKAGGLIQLAGSAQYLISPVIAGILMNHFDIKMILMIDIGTFIAAAAAVFMIKKQAVSSRTRAELKFWDGIADSLRYLYSKKGISPV
jgi:MFS family permease